MTGHPTPATFRPGPPAAPLTNPRPDLRVENRHLTDQAAAALADEMWSDDDLTEGLTAFADLVAERVAERVQVAAVARIPADLRPILRNGCHVFQLFTARPSDDARIRVDVTDAGVFVSIDANGNSSVAVLRLLFAETPPP